MPLGICLNMLRLNAPTGNDEPARFLTSGGSSLTSFFAQVAKAARQGSIMARGRNEATSTVTVSQETDIKTMLFEASSGVKVLFSKIAMHLDTSWRNRLFENIDDLHDPLEWDNDDKTLSTGSFYSFMRAWLLWRPVKNPALGISVRGNLLAGWICDSRRLTLEFFEGDEVSYLISPQVEGAENSGLATISSLREKLAWFEIDQWLVPLEG